MSTIRTPRLNLAKPTVNSPETENTWGFDLNANMDKIDATVVRLGDVAEAVDDRVGQLIKAGHRIGVVYNDNANTLTINNLYGPEESQDQIFDTLKAGNNVAISYDEVGNRITIHSLGPGGSTGPQNVFDTIHDARLAEIPAQLKSVMLMGYNRPGDAGPAMQCRRSPAMNTNHKGVFRTADRYTDAGILDNTNGGWWEYIANNQRIWAEWFGAVGDYYDVKQDGSGTTVNPDPTDNWQAITDASKFIWTFGGNGGLGSGGVVQLGVGGYYVSDTIVLDRTVAIEGVGSGYYHDGAMTKLLFAAGKAGFMVHSAGEGINGASGTVFRNVFIAGLGHAGFTDKHGVIARGRVYMYDCSITGFGGSGYFVVADVGAGSNANSFFLQNCAIYNNALDGITASGGDANAGGGIMLSVMGNGRWGINDQSFLANTWIACHASGNGDLTTGYGGAYRGAAQPTTFYGCYSESDQPPSYAGNSVVFEGGFHGAGVIVEGTGVWRAGPSIYGPSIWRPNTQFTAAGDKVIYAHRTEAHKIWSMSNDVGGAHDFRHVQGEGYLLEYNNNSFDRCYGFTPAEGSLRRDPPLKPNRFMIPNGTLLGGNWDQMRWLMFNNGPPNEVNQLYKPGDIALDLLARQAGWICKTEGLNAPSWASGTIYNVGDVRRTPAGSVYECTRVPYDPDRWTMPALTVKPTHGTGMVMAPEPNPEIDLGEASTIPGYALSVIADNTAFSTWDDVVNKVWPTGLAFRVPETGIAYWCPVTTGSSGQPPGYSGPLPFTPGIPVPPTPIFNTPWGMPASTIEPTHLSGTQEYREPNPSPSGSEPATIPGYIWRYITAVPTPTWASFGDLFVDGTALGSMAGVVLASGAASTVSTIPVPGSAYGDFVEVTGEVAGGTLGIAANGWVSVPGTVSYNLYNPTNASVTLGPSSWRARVRKRASV